MIKKSPEELLEEIEGLDGDGSLTLAVACTKCDGMWHLNTNSVAMAWTMSASFIEYLKYVHASHCPNCDKPKE